MDKKIYTLNDVFNDPEFDEIAGKSDPKGPDIKSEEDILIDAFEEVNFFVEQNGRVPDDRDMIEHRLSARLKSFSENQSHKVILRPFDRFDILDNDEITTSLEDVLIDDEFGLLEPDGDSSIFDFKHTPKTIDNRSDPDYVAQRKPMEEKDFVEYERLFFQVHRELREGKREIKPFKNAEKNLKPGQFYIMDGVLLYLESVRSKDRKSKHANRDRGDRRTLTIFENGTYSDMLFSSLGKQILKNGKLVTQSVDVTLNELSVKNTRVNNNDVLSGWIYTLQTKSDNPELRSIKNLYKIGFTTTPVRERIKNAKSEATYLFADVKNVNSWRIYNWKVNKLENLLHRFFATRCLNLDLFAKGQRINPREWFVVPFHVIEDAIILIQNQQIFYYRYDPESESIKLR